VDLFFADQVRGHAEKQGKVFCAAFAARLRFWSSPKAASGTQCGLFSMQTLCMVPGGGVEPP